MAATQEETLIEAALRMALLGRHPSAELVFHSDRGSQYTSDRYRAALAEAGISVSMSRTGNCYDNAVDSIVFRDAQGRVCRTRVVPDAQAGQASHLRVCRVLLQPHSATLFARLSQPACL